MGQPVAKIWMGEQDVLPTFSQEGGRCGLGYLRKTDERTEPSTCRPISVHELRSGNLLLFVGLSLVCVGHLPVHHLLLQSILVLCEYRLLQLLLNSCLFFLFIH